MSIGAVEALGFSQLLKERGEETLPLVGQLQCFGGCQETRPGPHEAHRVAVLGHTAMA